MKIFRFACTFIVLPAMLHCQPVPQIVYTYSKWLTAGSVEMFAGIRPNGIAGTAQFRCSITNPSFTPTYYETTPRSYPTDTGLVEISQVLSGLPTDSSYTFAYGVDLSTDSAALFGQMQSSRAGDTLTTPELATLRPLDAGLQKVSVSARCNTHGAPTFISFSWSSGEYYYDGGWTVPVLVTSTKDTVITAEFTGLVPAVKYYIQAFGMNAADSAVAAHGEYDSIMTMPDSNAVGVVTPLTVLASSGIAWTGLNFGLHTYATDCIDVMLGEFELPPVAPGFDVRFANIHPAYAACNGLGTYADLRPFVSPAQADTYRVRITADPDQYPMIFFWPPLDSSYTGAVTLRAGTDTINMKTSQSYILSDPDVSAVTIIARLPVPRHFEPDILIGRTDYFDSAVVQLHATVNPNGLTTTVWFEWGPTTSYGSQSSAQFIDPRYGVAPVAAHVSKLASGTLYHFRIVSQNSHGTWTSADGLFSIASPLSVPTTKRPLPDHLALLQNYPNPFNPSTEITYTLPARTRVTLRVYDILGKEVALLADGLQEAGYKRVSFSAVNLPSGVYIYVLNAGTFREVRKMLILK